MSGSVTEALNPRVDVGRWARSDHAVICNTARAHLYLLLLGVGLIACTADPPPPDPAPAPLEAPEEVTPERVVAPERPAPEPLYAGLVWARGIPQGVLPIDAERARHQAHYRLSEEDGSSRSGNSSPGSEGRTWLSAPGAAGTRMVTHFDAEGETLMVEDIVEQGTKVRRRDARGLPHDLACALYTRALDAQGRTLIETCVGAKGGGPERPRGRDLLALHLGRASAGSSRRARSPPTGALFCPLERTHFGEKRVFDDHGLLIQRMRLDASGKALSLMAGGVTSEEWDYDDLGRLIERRFEGPDGAMLRGPEGWALETRRYEVSDAGTQVSIQTFDAQGQAARRAGGAVAKVEERRDSLGGSSPAPSLTARVRLASRVRPGPTASITHMTPGIAVVERVV